MSQTSLRQLITSIVRANVRVLTAADVTGGELADVPLRLSYRKSETGIGVEVMHLDPLQTTLAHCLNTFFVHAVLYLKLHTIK